MMIKNGLLSRIFVVILITLFTVTFSYADNHEVDCAQLFNQTSFTDDEICRNTIIAIDSSCYFIEAKKRGLSCGGLIIPPKIPSISHLDSATQASINSFCSNAKAVEGPVKYIECLNKQLSQLGSKKIPNNAHKDGNSWTCNTNYYRNNAETGCLRAPANASSSYSSNIFKCNTGYSKSGNSCIKSITIPPNSHANGNSWVCNTDYYKDGSICRSVPANAFSKYTSNDWYCNTGYFESGNVCEKEKNSLPKIFMALFALIAISLLVIITLFKVTIKSSFPFYTLERKIPVEKGDKKPKPSPRPLSKPEEPEVKIPSSDIEGNISYQTESIKNLKNDIAVLLKNINDMNQTFMTLKTNLDQKDEEISRYKYGYDATIFKNFLLRFTRVDKVIKEYINDNKIDLNGLKDIQISMNDALAECEVEIFSPDIGADFKTTIGVADNPEIRHTSNKAQDSIIAEILQPGYRRKLPDNSGNEYQIIIEAKVAIYVHKDT